MAAYCTACGQPRVPLASSSVTLAGQPSKVGGTVARAIGWIVLIGGLTVSLMLALLGLLIFTPMTAVVLGVPTALATIAFSLLLLKSGRGLQEIGAGEQKSARAQAIFALAQNRGGLVTAMDVAHALDIRADEADALLTELAKTTPDQVSLEVDDAGGIYYRFPAMLPAWAGVRVEAGPDTAGKQRVDGAQPAEVPVLEAEVIPPGRQQR